MCREQLLVIAIDDSHVHTIRHAARIQMDKFKAKLTPFWIAYEAALCAVMVASIVVW